MNIFINLLFIFISTLIIILCLFKKNIKDYKIDNFINKNYHLLVIILFIIAFFISFYKLGKVPSGMHIDEAGMAYDAFSLANYGLDRYLNKFPVYLINFGGGQSAMYAYLAALAIKIFNYNIITIRLPAIIMKLFIILCGFKLVEQNTKDKTNSLIMLLLLAINPYFIMQGKWGLDCNLLVGFFTISTFLLYKSITTNNNFLLFISGLFFGLSLYTYSLSYLIIPCFLLLTFIYLLIIKKITIKKIILFSIPLFVLAVPLILMILVNNNILDEIKSFITIPKLPYFRNNEISIKNIFKSKYIIITILTCDHSKDLIYNAVSNYGTIYYMCIPFFLMGIFSFMFNIKKSLKCLSLNSIMFFWFISVLFCMLIIESPNINKANAIFFPIVYFIADGIALVVKKNKFSLIPILILLLINFCLFFNYYFFHYNSQYKNQIYWTTDYINILNYSNSFDNKKVYIEPNLVIEEYIYSYTLNKINPNNFNTSVAYLPNNKMHFFYIPNVLDTEALYIVRENSIFLKKLLEKNFICIKCFDEFCLYQYK